ncbi:MAG: hypothetical protein R3D00_13425 [Bacteroidia bacterium]
MIRYLPVYLPAIAFIALLSPPKGFAQHMMNTWGVGTSGGMAAGWWIYDKGFNDTLPTWHEGYDRTHLSAMFQSGFTLDYRSRQFYVSAGVGFSSLRDNIMISSADRRRTGTRYRISDGNAMPIFSVFLMGGYNLYHNKSFSFTPTLSTGTFFVKTTHPQKAYFKYKYFYDIGIRHVFHLSENWDFSVYPHYSQMIITTRPEANKGSGHHIYTVGVNFAFSIWII